MMIRLLEFGLLFFAIRKTWCEHHLCMLAAVIDRLLRGWPIGSVFAVQTAKAKLRGPRRARRAQLRLVPILERRYWRPAKGTLNGYMPGARLRRR